MTGDTLVRIAALGLALASAVRNGPSRLGLALFGLAVAVAAFGVRPVAVPSPAGAAFSVLVVAAGATAAWGRLWPPLLGDALRASACAGLPAALWAAAVFRHGEAWQGVAGALAIAAAASLFGAEGARASSEAGWRRALGWVLAVTAPTGLVAGLMIATRSFPGRSPIPAALAAAAAVLAWTPMLLAERYRLGRILPEEIALGILPLEDLAVLRSPWRRVRERRLGRSDERREYVRSALLLTVARQQQLRRSGEASRLRHLEVLSFRTRLRRTLEARGLRARAISPDDLS